VNECIKKIFVSSTYEDLIEEREIVRRVIEKMHHMPTGMELFCAADESQWDTIKRTIDEADFYVIILGPRYGSLV